MKKFLSILMLLALLFMVGCEKDDEKTDVVLSGILLTESDFISGYFGVVDTTSNNHTKGMVIDQDAKILVAGGSTYILEKTTSSIICFESDGDVEYQKSIIAGYNPQDLVASGKTGYVIGYDKAQLYVLNLENGTITDSIDLSGFANNNTTPNAISLALVGNDLYVGMQRLEAGAWAPSAVSYIGVIDITTKSIVDTIICEGYNLSQLIKDGSDIYVLNSGDTYGSKDFATIEKVNSTDNSITTLMVAKVDGDPILSFTQRSGNEFYAVTYHDLGNRKSSSPVYRIDVTSGSVLDTVAGIANAFGGIVYDASRSMLYAGERGDALVADAPFGVALYDEVLDSVTLINTELPPSSLVLK